MALPVHPIARVPLAHLKGKALHLQPQPRVLAVAVLLARDPVAHIALPQARPVHDPFALLQVVHPPA
eukprot:1034159-Prymnesium_polylepis.1